MITRLEELLKGAKNAKIRIAVAQADDDTVLSTILGVKDISGTDSFILIGDKDRIKARAEAMGLSFAPEQFVNETDEAEMARRAVAMVHSGEAHLPMKGLMQTSTFMRAILNKETGLRDRGVISEISLFEKEWGDPGLQIASCCAINLAPDLNQKRQIIENAVWLARKLGIATPRVALICALEQINPDMPETLEAAALAKMGDRGQIKGAVIDGPFALDNAVSPEQAAHKGLTGPVAGRADILIMANILMGNIFHKSLTYFAKKRVPGIILGARVPILMNSRSDFPEDRVLSIALAMHLLQE